MPASVEELVARLAAVQTRNSARDELIRLGAPAIPALLRAAKSPRNIDHRKTVLRTLLQVADRRSAEAFRDALRSKDEEIRAIGARGLHLLRAPDALSALEAAFNDAPDPLHAQETPAAVSLIEMGIEALPAILNLMDSVDDRTRERAQHALAKVVLRDIRRRLSPRSSAEEAQRAWEALQWANGSYRWDGPEAARKASLALWRSWLASLAP